MHARIKFNIFKLFTHYLELKIMTTATAMQLTRQFKLTVTH